MNVTEVALKQLINALVNFAEVEGACRDWCRTTAAVLFVWRCFSTAARCGTQPRNSFRRNTVFFFFNRLRMCIRTRPHVIPLDRGGGETLLVGTV